MPDTSNHKNSPKPRKRLCWRCVGSLCVFCVLSLERAGDGGNTHQSASPYAVTPCSVERQDGADERHCGGVRLALSLPWTGNGRPLDATTVLLNANGVQTCRAFKFAGKTGFLRTSHNGTGQASGTLLECDFDSATLPVPDSFLRL